MILHLSYLGYRSWCREGIDARQCLDLAQKVPVADALEVKLSTSSLGSIESDGKQQHAFVVAADED